MSGKDSFEALRSRPSPRSSPRVSSEDTQGISQFNDIEDESLSLDELRAKIREAEERSACNKHHLQAAGERGQVLLEEEAQIEARLSSCESLLAESGSAMPEEELPSSVHGRHGDLQLPTSACGLRIYRHIVCKHAETHKLGQEIVSMEKELENSEAQMMKHKALSSSETAPGWDSLFGQKSKDGTAWGKLKGKGAAKLADWGRVDDLVLQRLHMLQDKVRDTNAAGKRQAEKRARERVDMERELIAARRAGNLTLAGLKQELSATKTKNEHLMAELAQLRSLRGEKVASSLNSMAELQAEVEDTNYGAEMMEAEIRNMKSEVAAAAADHHVATTTKNMHKRLASLIPPAINGNCALSQFQQLPRRPPQAMGSDAGSDESEVWDGNLSHGHPAASSRQNSSLASEVSENSPSQRMSEASSSASSPARAKRRARMQGPAHSYRDVDVVVNTTSKEQMAKERKLHDMLKQKKKKKHGTEDDSWGTAAWAAYNASNMMGDVLLKIDEMTRATSSASVAKEKSAARRARKDRL